MSQCVKIVFLQIFGLSKMRFSKRKVPFFVFVFFMLERERNRKRKKKKENGKGQKNYKNSVFLKVFIQNCEESERMDFFFANII